MSSNMEYERFKNDISVYGNVDINEINAAEMCRFGNILLSKAFPNDNLKDLNIDEVNTLWFAPIKDIAFSTSVYWYVIVTFRRNEYINEEGGVCWKILRINENESVSPKWATIEKNAIGFNKL